MTPQLPTPGTDNAKLLEHLMTVYPETAYGLDAKLHMKTNSRASNLRELGWDVQWSTAPNPRNPRKRHHGYRLATPPALWPDAGQTSLEVAS